MFEMKYGLMLNDMRESNIENLKCVKASADREELESYHNSLLVEPYMDGQWRKVFRKGSELEWFNAGMVSQDDEYFGGIYRFQDHLSLGEIMGARLDKY